MNLTNKNKPMNRRNANQNEDKNSREYQEQLLSRSRGYLLTVIIFTIINLVLLVLEQGTYFLFSASVPYYLTVLSQMMDGAALGQNTTMALVISAVILVGYFLCWLLSAKKPVWLTVGMCIFILDTVALIYVALKLMESPLNGIVDLLIHALLIWEMSKGVTAAKNLKDMPETLEGRRTSPDL